MEGDLRPAIEAGVHHAGAGPHRGIAPQTLVAPGTASQPPGAVGVVGNGGAAGQTDLATVGVAAQHQV